jgi:hypothetical protein
MIEAEAIDAIALDALRRYMTNSDLSDQRISRLMGVEIETLRTWLAGKAIPQRNSVAKIRSFLEWHGRKCAVTLARNDANILDITGTSQKSR